MKCIHKKFNIILIVVFLFSLTPASVKAITQNQINSTVLLACTNDSKSWSLGSGTIFSSDGLIITNKHVVTDEYGNTLDYCLVSITENISSEPSFDYLSETIYWSSDESLDAAILKIDNENNKIFKYVDIWSGTTNSLDFGNKIEVIGFPGIGGMTITYSSGDFSGFGSISDGTQNYIKSTVPLEHGNSGGGAYNTQGNFIGVPTMVVTGELNSISYILKIDSIKKWMSNLLGVGYNNILQNKVIDIAPNKSDAIDYNVNVSPINLGDAVLRVYPMNDNGDILWDKQLNLDEENSYSNIYYEWEGLPDYFIDYSNFSRGINTTIVYSTSVRKDSLNSGYNIFTEPARYALYNKKNPNFPTLDSTPIGEWSKVPIFVSGTASLEEEGAYYIGIGAVKSGVLYPNDKNRTIRSGPLFWQYNYKKTQDNIKVDYNLINRLKGYILLQVEENGEAWYIEPNSSKRYYLKDGAIAYEALRKFGLGITDADLAKIPVGVETKFTDVDSDGDGLANQLEEGLKTDSSKYDTDGDGVSDGNEVLKNNTNPLGSGKLYYSTSLVSQLKGRILLQVQSHGEAWYLNPKDGKRYYMKNGDAAYQIMRFLSLGITNSDLSKIPIGSL